MQSEKKRKHYTPRKNKNNLIDRKLCKPEYKIFTSSKDWAKNKNKVELYIQRIYLTEN